MNHKRILSATLAGILSVSILLPSVTPTAYASANVTSSFSDVADPAVARDADVLRLMGVVTGTGSNHFNPNASLTRGEFSLMIVKLMGKASELPLYATRTIFTDVPASHWASPAINLAASTKIGEDSPLISGVGDGSFRPNDIITFAQATTILLRVLGYNDEDTGAIWPQGYLNVAKSIGLTDGLNLTASQPITRAQAASLFVQALRTNTKSGSPYYTTLGSMSTDDVMLLATNITTQNGISGAISTSEGTYPTVANPTAPTALEGARGTLVLNDKQQIVTFVPDDSSSISGSLTSDARATYLMVNNQKYMVNGTVPVFTFGSDSSESTYASKWFDLSSGTKITLFIDGGIVTALYVGQSQIAKDAVVVSSSPSASDFYGITNGSTSFTIERNGMKIGIDDLKAYDVVTYDSSANTLIVSDLRISVNYEYATPNSATPTSIHALGHDFPVLENALEQSDDVRVGEVVTLLLTADGSVAAVKKGSSKYHSTAYGIASGSSVEMVLPAGGTITLTGNNTLEDREQDRLVSVGSTYSGKLSTYLLSSNGGGTLDVDAMTLGTHKIAPNCKVYESVSGGAIVSMSFSSLDVDTIPSSKIAYYRTDSSDNVTVIVLDNVTGNGYTYGMLEETPNSAISNRTVTVKNSGTGSMPAITNLVTSTAFKSGDFGGVTIGGMLEGDSGERRASSVILLNNVGTVSRSDFFNIGDDLYVKLAGTTYQIASEVECYNADMRQWTTLDNLRAQADSLSIHVDPIANMVRVISGTEK